MKWLKKFARAWLGIAAWSALITASMGGAAVVVDAAGVSTAGIIVWVIIAGAAVGSAFMTWLDFRDP